MKANAKKKTKSAVSAKKRGNVKLAKSSAEKPQKALTKALLAKGKKYYTLAYKPRETILDHGAGSVVWDIDGNEYIDLGAGIAVCSLGHSNRELVEALTKQAKKIWHTSNTYFTEPPILLAEELITASKFARRVFITNSGAEANEAAIKLARKYAADKGKPPEKREIITFSGSFHGRTMATITATAQPKYQAGFEPMPPGFRYCPFNDFDAITAMVNDNTCAVMLEVIQGEGGIMPAKPGFVEHVQNLCRKVDALLMIDDVQAGMGRTGKLLSHFGESGVKPDVVTLAKALGGGIPIGATLIGERVENTFQFGSHGSTFGGNPMACAVARVVLRKIQSAPVVKNISDRSKQLKAALNEINKRLPVFNEVRGRGLMIGAELRPQWHGKAGEITELARRHGLLLLQAGPNVLRFVPPLVITEKELKEGMVRLQRTLETFLSQKK